MGVYIIIYLVLCVLSVICAVQSAKRNKNDLMKAFVKAFVILSLAAGFVLALGLYDPSKGSGDSVLYVSGSGGTGGMNLWSLIKVCLFAMPPMIIGALAASGSSKKR